MRRYFIDLDAHEKHGRSFQVMVESRLCASCHKKLGSEVEEQFATLDTKSGRVIQQIRKVPYGSNPITLIRDCCSKAKGFIKPNMPLKEVLFRILLVNGNQPLDPEEIQQQLEWMGYGERSNLVTAEVLENILGHDDFYMFRSQDTPQEDLAQISFS
ncbi:MAG: hypothetical protein HYX88_04485 [Chloroflexi bacterium]|nr:hypothetical protein [Chloroflexota bacterium]